MQQRNAAVLTVGRIFLAIISAFAAPGCGHEHLSMSIGETMQGHDPTIVVCRRRTTEAGTELVLKVSSDAKTVGAMQLKVVRRSPRWKVLYDDKDARTLQPFDPAEVHISVTDVAAGDVLEATVVTTCEHGKSSHAKADCSVI